MAKFLFDLCDVIIKNFLSRKNFYLDCNNKKKLK